MSVNYPIYKALVTTDEEGIQCISLVDYPAVEINWQYLAKNEQPLKFQVQDEEKRLIRGVIMESDKLIYRRTDDGFEYYLTFDADAVRTMAEKYLKDGFQNQVDTMHSFEMVNGVHMVQWFISDKENGVNPAGFEDVNDHSLFAEFKVENDEIWEGVKDGTWKGFSLAGTFNIEPVEMSKKKENVLEDINDMLDKIISKISR